MGFWMIAFSLCFLISAHNSSTSCPIQLIGELIFISHFNYTHHRTFLTFETMLKSSTLLLLMLTGATPATAGLQVCEDITAVPFPLVDGQGFDCMARDKAFAMSME